MSVMRRIQESQETTDHSLSRLLQGLRPVAHSRTTQPNDHMSIAPWRPRLLFRMTSGDMYMGVPVRLLFMPNWPLAAEGAAVPAGVFVPVVVGAGASEMRRVRCIVRWFFAMIFAAPKSTYLMTPI